MSKYSFIAPLLTGVFAVCAAAQEDLVPLSSESDQGVIALAVAPAGAAGPWASTPARGASEKPAPMIEISPAPRRLKAARREGLTDFSQWMREEDRPAVRTLAQPLEEVQPKGNTDTRYSWREQCARGSNAVCGVDEEGRFTMTYADGTRYVHLGYDGSKRLGERNTLLIDTSQTVRYNLLPGGVRSLLAAAAVPAAAGTAHTQIITASPLVFDLQGDGVRASDRWIRYDLDGSGRRQRLHDIASSNGLLVFDCDGNGIAGEHGRELFGTATDLDGDGKPDGYEDGFAALEAFLRRAEREGVLVAGALGRGRLEADDLSRLGRAYGLSMRVGGLLRKAVSLEEAGVRNVALTQAPSVRFADFDGQGDDVVRRAGAVFTRADGSTGAYEDIFFIAKPERFRKVAPSIASSR